MEGLLQVATIMVGFVMFISTMGIIVNGFQCMLADGDVRIAVEAKTQIMAESVALVLGSFALMILEMMKVSEGVKTTTEVYEVMNFVALFVLGVVVIMSVLGGVCILVSKLWKKRSNASLSQTSGDESNSLTDATLLAENDMNPQERAAGEMEKVLLTIKERY